VGVGLGSEDAIDHGGRGLILTDILSRAGYDVMAAQDARTAVLRMQSSRADHPIGVVLSP
jgi:hypothetical protein